MTTGDHGGQEWLATERYVFLVKQITRLLAGHDPVGIVNGNPRARDEYDLEAGQIVRLVLRDASSAEDAARIVEEVFAYYFAGVPCHDLSSVSREVWRACGSSPSPTEP